MDVRGIWLTRMMASQRTATSIQCILGMAHTIPPYAKSDVELFKGRVNQKVDP